MQYDEIVKAWDIKDLEYNTNAWDVNLAYNSCKIENENVTYFDTREIFEHDCVSNYTGDLRTIFEIRNTRDALLLCKDAWRNARDLDAELLKDLHRELTKNTYDKKRWELGERPGEYKRHDFVTGRDEVGAPPEDVEEEIEELLEELNVVRDPLTIAAYFHAKFENIHPFADGSGRVGRLAMNYLLVRRGHPPVTIFAEDKRVYYDALEAWDTRQDLEPLKQVLREQTVKTWGRWSKSHVFG